MKPGIWQGQTNPMEFDGYKMECGCSFRVGYRSWRGGDQHRAEVDYCPLHEAAGGDAGHPARTGPRPITSTMRGRAS